MSEASEVAATLRDPGSSAAAAPRCLQFDTFDAALAHVVAMMPDESDTVLSNVAWELVTRG